MRVACYTCIAGDYDSLLPHPVLRDVDFIAFSDRDIDPNGWDLRSIDPIPERPRLAAKMPKILPDRFLPDYETTIWIDGSHLIVDNFFVRQAIESMGDSEMALYKHPWRDCIYDEANASMELQKYKDQPIWAQVDAYRAEGHPEHFGLWACGTLVRRNTPRIANLMDEWWREISKWSIQDQISLPVVFRRAGFQPATFPHHQVFGNPWISIQPHHSEL